MIAKDLWAQTRPQSTPANTIKSDKTNPIVPVRNDLSPANRS
jgi:hypothetical protein